MFNDLRFGIRQLAKHPGFTAVAALTLALGIGVNTAIFSVFKGVVLEPFPYPQAGRLVHIWGTDIAGRGRNPLSGPDYFDFRDRNQTFEEMGVYCPYRFNLSMGGGEPINERGVLCSASVLRTLGARPKLGRLFTDADEAANNRPVLLSYDLWREHFEARAGIVGTSVILNGKSHVVVGVMPEDFEFLAPWFAGQRYSLWTPFPEQGDPGRLGRDEQLRDSRWMLAVGRLRPGVTHAAAEADLKRIAVVLAGTHPASNGRRTVWVEPFLAATVGSSVARLLILMATVGFVLLVACANVASLVLAKSAGRLTEVAVRAALGAPRGRIVGQMLMESLALALLGGTLGVLLAHWGLAAMQGLLPPDLPRTHMIRMDGWVLAFTFGLTLGTTLLFGLAPALVAARTNIVEALREGTGSQAGIRVRNRLLRWLAAAQFAIALLVTNQAMLLVQSLHQVLNLPQAFDTEQVLTALVQLSGGRYESPQARVAFWEQLLERVRGLPQVERAAVTTQLPLGGGGVCYYRLEGEVPSRSAIRRVATRTYVNPDYFEAMGIARLSGRSLQTGDERLPEQRVVVNRALAEHCWPGRGAVGQRLYDAPLLPAWSAVVVGVVESVRQHRPEQRPQPEIYWLYNVNPWAGSKLVVRAKGDPKLLLPAVREAVAQLDPNLPLSEIQTMGEVLAKATQGRRLLTVLVTLFAGLILTLAMTGLYGQVSGLVAQRTRELGVRIALGAGRRELIQLVIWEALRLSGVGLAIGLIVSANLAFITRGLIFGIGPFSVVWLVIGTLLALVAALAAAAIPAWRASRLDPAQTLRAE
jgi:predicted permease